MNIKKILTILFFVFISQSLSATLQEHLEATLRSFFPDSNETELAAIMERLSTQAVVTHQRLLAENETTPHLDRQTRHWQLYFLKATFLKDLYLSEQLHQLTQEEISPTVWEHFHGALYPLLLYNFFGIIEIVTLGNATNTERGILGALDMAYGYFIVARHHYLFLRSCTKIGQKAQNAYGWCKKEAKWCWKKLRGEDLDTLPPELNAFFDALEEEATVEAMAESV